MVKEQGPVFIINKFIKWWEFIMLKTHHWSSIELSERLQSNGVVFAIDGFFTIRWT